MGGDNARALGEYNNALQILPNYAYALFLRGEVQTVLGNYPAAKQDLDPAKAVALMAANLSCIKRPVVEHPGGLLVGFKPEAWAAAF